MNAIKTHKGALDMTEEIYQKIAENNGVSVEEVKREIQLAINSAYVNPNEKAKSIKCEGDIPTPEEFFAHVLGEMSASANS
jgi:hypothetical protein